MPHFSSRFLAANALGCILLTALWGGTACADDVPTQIQALVAKQSPTVVTVKVVLKYVMTGDGASQTSESRTELEGVVVDPSGLIMVSNLPFSPQKMIEVMGLPSEAAENAPKIVPTDFKVTFERESTEYSAFLAATDTSLGLAFLQIQGLSGRTLSSVTFASTSLPSLGDQVFTVARLSKGYDYAPFYESARVSGVIAKPRSALMLDGSVSEIGMPVYSLAGDVVGVLGSVASGVESSGGNEDMSMRMMMRLFGGSGGGNHGGVFVIPGSAVAPVIAQAKARAAQLAATQPLPAPSTPAK